MSSMTIEGGIGGRYCVDEQACSTLFQNIDKIIGEDLTYAIDKFDKTLDSINDGVVWNGSVAHYQIRKLIEFYNEFRIAYNNLIEHFAVEVPKIFSNISNLSVSLGGNCLNVSKVTERNFKPKELNGSVSPLAAETGLPGALNTSITNLQSCVGPIQDSFTRIKTEISKIGKGSEILDLSCQNPDNATLLQESVNSYIGNLDMAHKEALEEAIDAMRKAVVRITQG